MATSTNKIALIAVNKRACNRFLSIQTPEERLQYHCVQKESDVHGFAFKDISFTESFFEIQDYEQAKKFESIIRLVLAKIPNVDRRLEVDEILPKFHHLKCVQPYYDECKMMNKNFEFRKNDRNYKVGDWIVLHEYDKERQRYVNRHEDTGEKSFDVEFSSEYEYLAGKIIYILNEFEGMKDGYCVLGVQWSIPNFEAKGLKSLLFH